MTGLTHCRSFGSPSLHLILDLGLQLRANAFMQCNGIHNGSLRLTVGRKPGTAPIRPARPRGRLVETGSDPVPADNSRSLQGTTH